MKPGIVTAFLYVPGMVAALLAPTLFSSAASAAEAQVGVHDSVVVEGHETKAKFHEDAAREMQTKAQEQKELLEHYQTKSHLYGRRAQDLQGHAYALANRYNKAAQAHIKEAELHRQTATKYAEEAYCVPPAEIERC
jgi:hypothetical protein